VFDSLSLHGKKDGLDRSEALGPMIHAMDAAHADGSLRADLVRVFRAASGWPAPVEVWREGQRVA
jgi:alpha-D-ribose 1-methylphosphonate 5-triphosphate diphosphatase PhnM